MSSSETELRHINLNAAGLSPTPTVKTPARSYERNPCAAAEESGGVSGGIHAPPGAHDSQGPSHEFPSLPPVDGGRQAWLFLAACFVVEMLVWGFPFAFGVFQKYYSATPPFAGQSNVAVIGTCAMGIMYLSGPIVIGLLRLFPNHARRAPALGLLIMCAALAASSFSTTVAHLVATQGVLYALGGSLTYCPCILYTDQWFVRRKGFAYGVMWSGTGLAGVLLPLLMESLLGFLGFRATLRLWSGLLFVLAAPLAIFVKPRVPVSQMLPPQHQSSSSSTSSAAAAAAAIHARPFSNLRFLLSRTFMLHQLANIVEASGFFLPGIYLPTYAQSALDASPFPSALTILLVNVSSVFGCVAMGSLVDRFPVPTCLMIASAGAALSTLLIWGFSSSLAALYVFCIVYGLFAGAYTSAWPGIMKVVAEHEREQERGVDPSMVFGMLAAGRGIGNLVSGPLSEALIRGSPWKGEAAYGYGSGYGTLIAFTGATALAGGASFVWKRVGWM